MKSRRQALLALSLVSAVLTGCFAAKPPAQAAGGHSELPLPEFMGHVMQRNAEQLWSWTAVETDATGEHSSAPRTTAEWENAESDALTLQQLTYALENSSTRVNDPRWGKLIGDLRASATASAKAAEAKDITALTKAGEDINERCVACHWAFAPQLEKGPPPVPVR